MNQSSPFSDKNQNPVMEGEEEVESAFPPRLDALMQAYQGSQGNPATWFCSKAPRTTSWMVSPEHHPAAADVPRAPSWLAPGPGAGPAPDELTSTSGFLFSLPSAPCPAAVKRERAVAPRSAMTAVDTPVRGPEARPSPGSSTPQPLGCRVLKAGPLLRTHRRPDGAAQPADVPF